MNRDQENIKLEIFQTGEPNHNHKINSRPQIRGRDRFSLATRVCAEGASNVYYDALSTYQDINQFPCKSYKLYKFN